MSPPGEGGSAEVVGRGLPASTWLFVIIGVHLALGLLLFDPTLFPGGDNATYMVLGDAIRTGRGYVDLYLPGAPLHTKYPPLFPLWLAGLGEFGGLQVFKASALVLTGIAVYLTYRLGARACGRVQGLAGAALVAVSPVVLEYSHVVLSEALFTVLVLAALLALDADARRVRLGGVGLAAAAFFTRSAGLPLLIAVPLFALARRERRLAVLSGIVAVLAIGGWSVYQSVATPDQPGYLQQLLLVNPYDPARGPVDVAGLLTRAAVNFWRYVSAELPGAFGSRGGNGLGGISTAGLGIMGAGLALVGWSRAMSERVSVQGLFVALYVLLIVLWPEVWTDRRFLLPILPVVVLYLIRGAERVGSARGRRLGPAVAAGAALMFAAPSVASSVVRIPDARWCQASYRDGLPCDLPAYGSFYAAAEWAAENTPSDAIFANRRPNVFYWISGRRGDLYPFSDDPEVVMERLEAMGAEYVVLDRTSVTTDLYLAPAIMAHADRFEVVYGKGDPVTLILRFVRATRNASRDGAPRSREGS
ncbi:MAG: ArnT family glycosyltransferase [Gemmatimonadota bacterium]